MKLNTSNSMFAVGLGLIFIAPQAMSADVVVIGSREAQAQLSGSGQYVSSEEIRTRNTGNVNDLIRRNVPGVTLFEEDGYGLFPNISFRGVQSNRSGRITLMEDGILMAPAPYSAPAAYYSPYVSRMSGLEVLKGSSQVLYGPATSGGVINYLSTPIPTESESYVKVMHGSFNETQTHIYHGDRIGNFSYLIEGVGRTTDGFKTIDSLENAQFYSDETGHRIFDPSIKLAYEFNTTMYQSIEAGFGRFDMKANETYVGLTDEDFAQNPYRRYSATRFDRIDTEQDRTYLRHYLAFSDRVDVTTTGYYNRFSRNWYKLHDVNSGAGNNSPLSNPADYGVLNGTADGSFRVRANARNYESRGVQQRWNLGLGDHNLTMGWRFHRDRVKRFQHQDTYTQINGAISSIDRGAPGSQADRGENAKAVAGYIQNEWSATDRLTLMPGIRYEYVKFSTLDNGGDAILKEGSLSVVNPALSFRYQLNNQNQIFGGVYKGSALPSPGSVTREENRLKDEKSYNFEIGARSRGSFYTLESTLFYTQLRDLLAEKSIASGVEDSMSVGKARTYGLEVKAAYDLGAHRGWSFSNSWYTTATFAKAQLGGDYSDSSDGYLTGAKGNDLPYSPDLQFTIGSTLENENFGLDIWGTYVAKMYSSAENLAEGKVDSHFVLNATAFANLNSQMRLLVQGQNILDKEYMASRVPYGARSGKPLSLLAGFEATF